jgi:hypothetical protein
MTASMFLRVIERSSKPLKNFERSLLTRRLKSKTYRRPLKAMMNRFRLKRRKLAT